jgi:transcriptional regulator with XRE-family HTH domain
MQRKPPSDLRLARERLGLTIRQLRDASGIATGRISMLERHMVKPSPSERERLASALEATVEQLFPAPAPAPVPVPAVAVSSGDVRWASLLAGLSNPRSH